MFLLSFLLMLALPAGAGRRRAEEIAPAAEDVPAAALTPQIEEGAVGA